MSPVDRGAAPLSEPEWEERVQGWVRVAAEHGDTRCEPAAD